MDLVNTQRTLGNKGSFDQVIAYVCQVVLLYESIYILKESFFGDSNKRISNSVITSAAARILYVESREHLLSSYIVTDRS